VSRAFEESLHGLRRLLQALDVGYVPARFHSEDEVLRRLGDPILERARLGKALEGAVHLDGGEARRIVLEPPSLREPPRVEAFPPVRVLPP
jgi:hypothetical protein